MFEKLMNAICPGNIFEKLKSIIYQRSISEKLINILYPRTCPICECVLEKNQLICDACRKEIILIREPECQKCGKMLLSKEHIYCKDCREHTHFFDRGVAVFVYHGKIQECIERFKFHNVREHTYFFVTAAYKLYGKMILQWKIDALIPIPVHKTKAIKRGYNQAQIFAQSLSEKIGIPVNDKILIRTKETTAQKGLTKESRYQNLKDAFAVNKEACRNLQNVLLVDDIYTTGSTMDICAELLKMAGVKKVYFLCIAIGIGEE